VALVRTDVSEESITSIIRVKRISELETTLQVTSYLLTNVVSRSLIFSTLMIAAIANFVPTYSIHPDYEGDTFRRNVGSYKSHAASHLRRRNSSNETNINVLFRPSD
jgi:hypothetical protein